MTFSRANVGATWLVLGLCFGLIGRSASAADKLWDNINGGVVNAAVNWLGALPGLFDCARFESASSSTLQRTYIVDFTNIPTNDQIVEDDNVNFVLVDHAYTLCNTFVATAIGTMAGLSGNLMVTDGDLSLPFQADLKFTPARRPGFQESYL